MDLSVIGYDPAGAWVKKANSADELLDYVNPSGITWINIEGLENAGSVNRLAEHFKIHPLTVEDILTPGQRPKVEEFEEYLFITLKSIHPESGGDLVFEQISLVLTGNTVITFQEIPGDSFDGIRKRIMNNGGRVRRTGADYLAYILIDAVVDEYFHTLDDLGQEIDDIEDRAMDEKDRGFIPDIQRIRQKLLRVRRAVWPLRESLLLLLRLDSSLLSDELKPFLKDLQENVIQVVETVETYREVMAGVMEVNLTQASNRMNQVMKVLTIISTIFIPLTFIVGVYGMNFRFMPELELPWAYPLTWGLMLLIAGGMLLFFKKRRWI
jgi:magnesium transporter